VTEFRREILKQESLVQTSLRISKAHLFVGALKRKKESLYPVVKPNMVICDAEKETKFILGLTIVVNFKTDNFGALAIFVNRRENQASGRPLQEKKNLQYL
jgi:hypothetical protein